MKIIIKFQEEYYTMLETKTFGGFVAKYKKSFVAKLSLSSDDTLAYYSDLKKR